VIPTPCSIATAGLASLPGKAGLRLPIDRAGTQTVQRSNQIASSIDTISIAVRSCDVDRRGKILTRVGARFNIGLKSIVFHCNIHSDLILTPCASEKAPREQSPAASSGEETLSSYLTFSLSGNLFFTTPRSNIQFCGAIYQKFLAYISINSIASPIENRPPSRTSA
jgi:hypothetical protein